VGLVKYIVFLVVNKSPFCFGEDFSPFGSPPLRHHNSKIPFKHIPIVNDELKIHRHKLYVKADKRLWCAALYLTAIADNQIKEINCELLFFVQAPLLQIRHA